LPEIDLKEWVFLKKWNRMGNKEKFIKYSEMASHEINFFLFMKDP
jgi:hypothetical protein